MRPAFTLGLIAMILPLLAISLLASPSHAQSPQFCAPRPGVLEALAETHGQTRHAIGLSGNTLIEIFVNRTTGDWTIHRVLPNGLACLMIGGQAFETLAETLPPQGDPL